MATETDLVGLGVDSFLAQRIGYQPTIITGVGTTQSGSPTVQSRNVTVQSATGNTAIQISNGGGIGQPVIVANPGTIGSSASALVYPPSGHTLNNGTNSVLNQPYTLAAYSMVLLWQQPLGTWYVK